MGAYLYPSVYVVYVCCECIQLYLTSEKQCACSLFVYLYDICVRIIYRLHPRGSMLIVCTRASMHAHGPPSDTCLGVESVVVKTLPGPEFSSTANAMNDTVMASLELEPKMHMQ